MAQVISTKLYQLRELMISEMFKALEEGETIVTKGGEVLKKGTSPQTLAVIAKFLKDNGVDHDAIEAPAVPITKALPFDDDDRVRTPSLPKE